MSAGTATQLLFQARAVTGPREIAFTSADNGQQSDPFLVEEDGSNLVQLTATAFYDETAPAWSPDGMKLAFVREALTDIEIRMIDFESMTETRILENAEIDGLSWMKMSWSPDGERLLFAPDGRLHTVSVDGSDLVDLGVAGEDGDFSPDGSEIVFTRDHQVFVINADGTGEQQLTESSSYWSWVPRWSPDGEKIVFGRKNPPEGGCGLFQL